MSTNPYTDEQLARTRAVLDRRLASQRMSDTVDEVNLLAIARDLLAEVERLRADMGDTVRRILAERDRETFDRYAARTDELIAEAERNPGCAWLPRPGVDS